MITASDDDGSTTTTTSYCGTSWSDAASCSTNCPSGINDACPLETVCFGDVTSCNGSDDDGSGDEFSESSNPIARLSLTFTQTSSTYLPSDTPHIFQLCLIKIASMVDLIFQLVCWIKKHS